MKIQFPKYSRQNDPRAIQWIRKETRDWPKSKRAFCALNATPGSFADCKNITVAGRDGTAIENLPNEKN